MRLDRTLTSTVYVLKDHKVLLHIHKKFNSLFPVGGKMEPYEFPHETALRETKEESGLDVILYDNDEKLELGKVQQLLRPIDILRENIGHEVENIDFIYFAYSNTFEVKPESGESTDFFWLTKEEVVNNNNIKPHIKGMALKALKFYSDFENSKMV